MDTISIIDFIRPYQNKGIFKGVYPCDKLPSKFSLPGAFVVNLSQHYESGSHWVAIYINEYGQAYYFDSFGFDIRNQYINRFLRLHSKNVIFNKRQLQHITSNKCGKFCCVFIVYVLKCAPINRFINMFSLNLFINDIVIESVFSYLKIN